MLFYNFRKIDVKGGSLNNFRIHWNHSSVVLNDTENDSLSVSCSFTSPFGGKVGLEDSLLRNLR